MTGPLLCGMVRLNREYPITRFLPTPAGEEAPRAGFFAHAVELIQMHAIETGDLLDADLRQQGIDIYEGGSFGRHARRNLGRQYRPDGTLGGNPMSNRAQGRLLMPRDQEILAAL